MSLKSIVANRDKFADSLVSTFSKEFEKMTPGLQRALLELFTSNNYTNDAIQAVFVDFGFDDLANEVATQFQKVARFSKEIAKETGYNFLITEENIQLFDEITNLNIDKILGVRPQITNDLRRFAIESVVEGRSVRQIRLGLENSFDLMGRNLNAEIYTGVQTYGRSIDFISMTNAGIEKYVYVGPLDNKTRTICQTTLNSPKQQTGWTLGEISESRTPFLRCGGFNCRHQWVPYVGEDG